jgi:drug/metabolite transporter (DMT)-like permease
VLLIGVLSVVALLVMVAAWQPRIRNIEGRLNNAGIKYIAPVFYLVWIVTALLFYLFFKGVSERWELLCLFLELAGVTFLAREVNYAQTFEERKNDLEKFYELKELEPNDYFRRYYEIAGNSKLAVEENRLNFVEKGQLDSHVEQLKSDVAVRIEKLNGDIADLLARKRKQLLILGLTLVTLALWGHGVLALTKVGEARAAAPESQATIESLKEEIVRLREVQTQQGQHIVDHDKEIAILQKDVEAIKLENKHWHVVRHRKPCGCTATPQTKN